MPVRPSVGTGQDWGVANIGSAGRPATAKKKATATSSSAAGLRYGAGTNASRSVTVSGMSARKLEESEDTKHAKVDKSLSKAIMQARMSKKWTQKQLATAINEKPQVVGEYESGKAIPNGALITKMERALGCKLPRTHKKKAAAGAKSSGGNGKKAVAVSSLTRGGPPRRR